MTPVEFAKAVTDALYRHKEEQKPMRYVKVNGMKLEVSKSEAERVSLMSAMNDTSRQQELRAWITGAPSDEAMARRNAVKAAFYPLGEANAAG